MRAGYKDACAPHDKMLRTRWHNEMHVNVDFHIFYLRAVHISHKQQ